MPSQGDPTAQTLLGHLTDRAGAHAAADLTVDERGLGNDLDTALASQFVSAPAVDGAVADVLAIASLSPLVTEWVAGGGGGGGVTLEQVQDDLGNTSLVAGTGISKTYNDGANTITLAVDTTTEAERIRDTIGTALVAGTGITVTPNDGADTITIAATAASGAPTVTTSANLGATQTIDFVSAASEQWLTGSLNANLAVTISNPVAGSRFVLLATQDGTGGRTVTIAGTAVDVPKAAAAQVLVVGRWTDASTFALETSGVQEESLVIPASVDLATAITVDTGVYRFPMPFDFIPTEVLGDLVTASSSGTPTFDINDDGASIFSTRPTFDVSETTLTTAATPAVISSTLIAKGSVITIDVDTAGTGTVGPTLVLNGLRVL